MFTRLMLCFICLFVFFFILFLFSLLLLLLLFHIHLFPLMMIKKNYNKWWWHYYYCNDNYMFVKYKNCTQTHIDTQYMLVCVVGWGVYSGTLIPSWGTLRRDSTLIPLDHWIVTHKIGQNVVVATAVLPQSHNLWEGRSIQQVNREMRSKDTGPAQ